MTFSAAVVLAPVRRMSLTLESVSRSITLDKGDQALALQLAPMLRAPSVFTGSVNVAYAAEISIDLALRKRVFRVTLTGNTIVHLANKSAAADTAGFFIEFLQGAPGGWIATYDPADFLVSDTLAPEFSSSAGKTDSHGFLYLHSVGKARLEGFNNGF